MSTNQITVSNEVNAPIERVWDCYTKSHHITQWNFASPEWCCPSASNDLQQGGKYVARMEAKDGSMGFDFEAIYTEVTPHKKLCYTMGNDPAQGRKATVTFSKNTNGATVTIDFDPEDTNPLDLQRNGWQAILDNFKKYTESL